MCLLLSLLLYPFSLVMGANKDQPGDILRAFHEDESGVAATEYITVFTLLSFGATLAMIMTTTYVKAYRDFMVWWYAHPAI